MKRLLAGLTLLGFLAGCVAEENMEPTENEILVVRIPRKKIANYLLTDGIKFYQEGQKITLLVPANIIYQKGSSNDNIKAEQIYTNITKFINTYRVEKLTITGGSHGSESNFTKDFAENRAQIFANNLRRHGLKVPLILSKGEALKELQGFQGYKLGEYLRLEFRFLRVLV